VNAEEFVEEYETEVGDFIKKHVKKEIILVSDCCGASVNLINSPVAGVESVWCDGCHKACNAISED